MITNKQLCFQLYSQLKPRLEEYAFFPASKKELPEFAKPGEDIVFRFTCLLYNSFDEKRRCSYYRVEPFVSISQTFFNAICLDIYEVNATDAKESEFYPLTGQLSMIIDSEKGEIINPSRSNLRYYLETDIAKLGEEIIDQFRNYALPFYHSFDSKDKIFQELSKPVVYKSLYSKITPQRRIHALIFAYLLRDENLKGMCDDSIEYFRTITNNQFKNIFKNLYVKFFGVEITL